MTWGWLVLLFSFTLEKIRTSHFLENSFMMSSFCPKKAPWEICHASTKIHHQDYFFPLFLLWTTHKRNFRLNIWSKSAGSPHINSHNDWAGCCLNKNILFSSPVQWNQKKIPLCEKANFCPLKFSSCQTKKILGVCEPTVFRNRFFFLFFWGKLRECSFTGEGLSFCRSRLLIPHFLAGFGREREKRRDTFQSLFFSFRGYYFGWYSELWNDSLYRAPAYVGQWQNSQREIGGPKRRGHSVKAVLLHIDDLVEAKKLDQYRKFKEFFTFRWTLSRDDSGKK